MDDPNMHAYGEAGPDDAEIGRQWREDSSLEKWFPITAERLAALEAEKAALKRDLQYARDGLTKGRTRMREDLDRLRAENARLGLEAYTWSKAAETYAKQAQRTPLDPVDVEELWDKANADDAADEVHHAFARLLERAHGIGA